jgi:hypothetical protein
VTTNDGSDERSLECANGCACRDCGQACDVPRPAAVLGGQQLGRDHSGDPCHEARREVDLTQEENEDLRHREQHEDRSLHEEVHDVAGAQELRVQRLEDDRDQDQSHDHG